jgi:hypothetical protein
MGGISAGWWVALGLLLGCGPAPPEVVGVYDGSGTTSSSGGSTAPTTHGAPGSTGPVADGSGGSTSVGTIDVAGSESDATTQAVDPETDTSATTSTDESTSVASTTDEPVGTTTGASQSCDDIYGMAPGYQLCVELDAQCNFDADLGGGDCSTMCSNYGGICLGALGNSSGGGCFVLGIDACDSTAETEICICSK